MNTDKLQELEKKSITKLLWEYSIPAVVGTLVMSTYNVIDRIFIGQGVGPEAIAGLAITFPVMNLSAAMGMLIGVGAASRTSIVMGQKNKEAAEKILGNSLVLTVGIAVIYLTIFGVFLDDILMIFGASEASLPYAHDFMAYILPGMLAMNLCFSFNNMMRASGYPRKAMITMFIGAGSNVILAPIFIFALDMGIKGAAIATDIAMTISMLFVMEHFFHKSHELHFKKGIFRLERRIVLSIIAIGASPFLINVTGSCINALINVSVFKYGGDAAVGAVGIFNTYAQLLVMIIVGLCQGMQPIVGYNYGARKLDRMKKAYFLTTLVATVITTLGFIGAEAIPSYIARAFTTDQNLISATAHGLSLTMLAFWMVGFQIVTTNLFQSLGMATKSIFLSLTRQVIFLVPCLLIFPNLYELDGVWTAFPTSDTLATVVTVFMVLWQFKKMKKRVEQENI